MINWKASLRSFIALSLEQAVSDICFSTNALESIAKEKYTQGERSSREIVVKEHKQSRRGTLAFI
jgi:hypothetical protein